MVGMMTVVNDETGNVTLVVPVDEEVDNEAIGDEETTGEVTEEEEADDDAGASGSSEI